MGKRWSRSKFWRLYNGLMAVPALVLVVGLVTAALVYHTVDQRRMEFNRAGLDRAVTAL